MRTAQWHEATSSAVSYPPIADYALIGDCHSVALVSRAGSVDWCCMPRIDAESCFGRILDWEQGGYCMIVPASPGYELSRAYLDDTLVLETRFRSDQGEARVLDAFTMRRGGREDPYCQLVRIVEGVRGTMNMTAELSPRFDYGEMRPWVRQHGRSLFTAIGGDYALVISGDLEFAKASRHDLRADFTIHSGQRLRLSIEYKLPHQIHPDEPQPVPADEIDERFARTVEWWTQWCQQARIAGPDAAAVLRSAIVLKALTNAPTGAIAAAATTSLPEVIGGERNWDYRYSWTRDSSFALQSLIALGFEKEALGFRSFLERTTADNVGELHVVYGVGGEHRLTEVPLDSLAGYRGSKPVRIGNAAHQQVQLDIYGELLEVAWQSSLHGVPPDEDYWSLLVQIVDAVTTAWERPDSGIWEVRSAPEHFVHSKVMCWSALDRGLRLAERCGLQAPTARWQQAGETIRQSIETRGYDRTRGVFVRTFDGADLDAALLLVPRVEFLAYDDERMVRTVKGIQHDLGVGRGLVRRYVSPDGLRGDEGAFLACSFWLVECLARQGNHAEARRIFDQVSALANDLGLFSEEYDVETGNMLGNFPQGLTHYSHICAALALASSQ